MHQPDEDADDLPVRIIDGHAHTTRAGIAKLAGWKAGGRTADVRAGTDPDFPHAAAVKQGRHVWYRMDGAGGVADYLQTLEHRAQAKKPPRLKDGDPNDLLDPDAAADAMHITRGAFDRYVWESKPFWPPPHGKGLPGKPRLPVPDQVSQAQHETGATYTIRQWRRATLAAHQLTRPGPGAGAGRPPSN